MITGDGVLIGSTEYATFKCIGSVSSTDVVKATKGNKVRTGIWVSSYFVIKEIDEYGTWIVTNVTRAITRSVNVDTSTQYQVSF